MRCTIVIDCPSDSREDLRLLTNEAVLDIVNGTINPAGTHVAGIGYYRVDPEDTP